MFRGKCEYPSKLRELIERNRPPPGSALHERSSRRRDNLNGLMYFCSTLPPAMAATGHISTADLARGAWTATARTSDSSLRPGGEQRKSSCCIPMIDPQSLRMVAADNFTGGARGPQPSPPDDKSP